MRRNLSILWLNSYFGSLLSIFGVLTYLFQNRGAETGWMHVISLHHNHNKAIIMVENLQNLESFLILAPDYLQIIHFWQLRFFDENLRDFQIFLRILAGRGNTVVWSVQLRCLKKTSRLIIFHICNFFSIITDWPIYYFHFSLFRLYSFV